MRLSQRLKFGLGPLFWLCFVLGFALLHYHAWKGIPQIYSGGVYPVAWKSGIRLSVWLFVAAAGWLIVPKNHRRLVVIPVLLLVCMAPAFGSSDVYYYSQIARLTTVYGENPYYRAPARVFSADDIFRKITMWENGVTVYGPILLLAQLPLGWISSWASLFQDSLGRDVILLPSFWFKGFLLLVHLANYRLVRELVRSNGADHRRASWLYLMNPLILFEGILQGHNILISGFFLLYSLFELQSGKPLRAVIVLSLGVLARLDTIWLLPVYWIYFLKRRAWKHSFFSMFAALGVVSVVGLQAWLYWPFQKTLGAYSRMLASSPPQLFFGLFCDPHQAQWVTDGSRILGLLLMLGVCMWHLRREWDISLVIRVFVIFLLIALCTNGIFHTWYVIPVACLLPLLDASPLRTALIIFSLSVFALPLQEAVFFGHEFWPHRVGEIFIAFAPWMLYLVFSGVRAPKKVGLTT